MSILDLFFPKICAGCGKVGSYLCLNCSKNILQTDLVCPNCERPAIGGKTHPLCRRKYGLDGLWSLGIYKDPLRKIIQKLKYRFVQEEAEVLVDLMLNYWAKYSPQLLIEIKKDQGVGWVIVPVPLHPKRQKWRGFNQAEAIGQILSKKIGLDCCNYLKRVRFTKPQVGLKSYERRKNIKNAFVLTNHFSLSTLHSMSILLIDDVWTTGATLKECCFVLKRAGAKKVWAITIAR